MLENNRRSTDDWQVTMTSNDQWKKGIYQVIMNGHLEDVSGNNLNNLLDQKLNADNKLGPEEVIRKFSI